MHVEVYGGTKVEITKADIQAVRKSLRRSKDMVCVDDLRRLLRPRIAKRLGVWPHHDDACQAANEAVPRLLSKWKREGLVDNPVRGHWVWVGESKAKAVVEDDEPAMWAVRSDGETEESYVTGYNNGDRGLVAHDFAGDDLAGWDINGEYDALLWVRAVKPEPEDEPGQAIRVRISRDLEAEDAWRSRGSGARSERRKGGK